MVSLQDLLNKFEDACYNLIWAMDQGTLAQIDQFRHEIDETRTKILEVFG